MISISCLIVILFTYINRNYKISYFDPEKIIYPYQIDQKQYDWLIYHGIKKYNSCELFEARNYFQAALDINPTGKYAKLGDARTDRELCFEYNMYCREYCDYLDYYIKLDVKNKGQFYPS